MVAVTPLSHVHPLPVRRREVAAVVAFPLVFRSTSVFGPTEAWMLTYVAIASMLGLALWNLILVLVDRRVSVAPDPRLLLMLGAVTGVMAIGAGRLGATGTSDAEHFAATIGSSVLVITLFAGGMFLPARSVLDAARLRRAVLGGAVLLVTSSLLLYAFGLEGSYAREAGPSTMMAALGLSIERQALPLASGYNNFAVLSAAVAAAVIVYAKHMESVRWRALGLAGAVAAATVVVLIDSRGAAFVGLSLIGVSLAFPKAFGVMARYAAVGVVVLTIGAVVFGPLVSELTAIFSTRTASDVGLNGRIEIWGVAAGALHGVDVADLVGHGIRSHVTSGLVAEYAWLVADPASSPHVWFATLHNSVLQAVFDFGYSGALVIIGVLTMSLSRLGGSRATRSDRSLQLFLVALTAAGLVEVSWLPYVPESYLFIVLGMFASVRPVHESAGDPRRSYVPCSSRRLLDR